MRRLLSTDTVATGLAIFSMFFGAGNVVFPLVIGRHAGDQNIYAVLGFLITAVGVPFLGLVSMVLFNGDYKKFFARLGKAPSTFIIVASMLLIGPFAAMPRTIALSYTTIQSFLPNTTLFYFSLLSCVLIFLCSYKKGSVVDLIGKILSPILLGSLIIIIARGFWASPQPLPMEGSGFVFWFKGVFEGYFTMDIFAGFFFSGVVIASLRQRLTLKKREEASCNKSLVAGTLRSGVIGLFLLGAIYTGFSYISSFFGSQLGSVDPDALISAIAFYTLGRYAGVIACVAVSLACLTTAIALAVVFSDFIRTEVFKRRISYKTTLLITLVITFAVSNLGFSGINTLLGPVLIVCYPALIVLAVINIAYKLWNVQMVKVPVFTTFAIALVYHLINTIVPYIR